MPSARTGSSPGSCRVVGGVFAGSAVGVRQPLPVANALFLAAPSQIAYAIYELSLSGQLGRHITISAAEFCSAM